MQAKGKIAAVSGRLIGYAQVSTEEQDTDPQLDDLRAAGCAIVYEEHASGAGRTQASARASAARHWRWRDAGRGPA